MQDRTLAADIRWTLDEPRDGVRTDVVYRNEETCGESSVFDRELELDTIGLAYLTDFYFDARYPGDDFSVVTEQEFQKCLSIMYDTVNKLKTLKL